jgi:hypothetical protein
LRPARTPWRHAPALLLASTPLVMLWGNWLKLAMSPSSYWDWSAIGALGGMALFLAAVAAIVAHRFDRWAASVLSLAAISAAWLAFLQPAASGAGAVLAGLATLIIWFFCALTMAAYALPPVRWLRWLTTPLLVAGCAPVLIWFAHDLGGAMTSA